MTIPTHPVSSSNIKEIGHHEYTLRVIFITKSTWDYSPVPEEDYRNMLNADSIGGWFSRNIRNNPNIKSAKIS